MKHLLLVLLFGIAGLFLGTMAHAGTIRHDRSDANYVNLAAQSQYEPVGLLLGKSHLCSGTLISDEWALSAAHCLDSGPTKHYSFTVGGNTYSGSNKFVHPDWNGNLGAGSDIALLQLSGPVTGVTPATLLTAADGNEIGLVGTAVGFGRSGTGLTGATGSTGTKRAGRNMIDESGSAFGWSDNISLWDFDNPLNAGDNTIGSAVPLNLEYNVGPGDSGGGMFVDVGGQTLLAGVVSLGWASDGNINSDYGDGSGYTRVSAFEQWISDTISGGGDGGGNGKGNGNGGGGGRGGGRPFSVSLMAGSLESTAALSLSAVPEPTTALLTVIGLLGLCLPRRRG